MIEYPTPLFNVQCSINNFDRTEFLTCRTDRIPRVCRTSSKSIKYSYYFIRLAPFCLLFHTRGTAWDSGQCKTDNGKCFINNDLANPKSKIHNPKSPLSHVPLSHAHEQWAMVSGRWVDLPASCEPFRTSISLTLVFTEITCPVSVLSRVFSG
jgi:hypothetical protein